MINYKETKFISKEFTETKYMIANQWISVQIGKIKVMNKRYKKEPSGSFSGKTVQDCSILKVSFF